MYIVSRHRSLIIEAPWGDTRCIVCLKTATLTKEHVLPQAIGGKLTCQFLCRNCNSHLGRKFEGFVKFDPLIQSTVNRLSSSIPLLAQQLTEGQSFTSVGPGGGSKGWIRGGEFVVKSEKLGDGSFIQPTPIAAKTIRKLLQQRAVEESSISRALHLFEMAPENTPVQMANDLHVVKWSIEAITPDLNGPLLHAIAPLKSAYEYLALHLDNAIYEELPGLSAARMALREGVINPQHLQVERLHGPDAKPFHGLLFEGNNPHATVQIRLFGKLAFRVHFKTLSVGGFRFIYTHDLTTNKEHVEQAASSDAVA